MITTAAPINSTIVCVDCRNEYTVQTECESLTWACARCLRTNPCEHPAHHSETPVSS